MNRRSRALHRLLIALPRWQRRHRMGKWNEIQPSLAESVAWVAAFRLLNVGSRERRQP